MEASISGLTLPWEEQPWAGQCGYFGLSEVAGNIFVWKEAHTVGLGGERVESALCSLGGSR